MRSMNSPVALDKSALMRIASQAGPNKHYAAVVAIITGLAAFVAASPKKGTLPALILVGLALALALVWWFLLRKPGRRGNDYSPLKTDAELARTPWSWKEEGRALIIFLLIFIPLNLASFFSNWIYGAVFAVATTIVTWFVVSTQSWRPIHYAPVAALPEEGVLRLRSDAEWLRAFLYASVIVPGGYQWRSDVVAKEVAEYGMDEAATKEALNTLVSQGEAALIRELRSHDGRVNWVTLTEKGRENFKNSVGI